MIEKQTYFRQSVSVPYSEAALEGNRKYALDALALSGIDYVVFDFTDKSVVCGQDGHMTIINNPNPSDRQIELAIQYWETDHLDSTPAEPQPRNWYGIVLWLLLAVTWIIYVAIKLWPLLP